jgi:hypothetical protein
VYNKPHLIVFGGNTGTVPINDVWILNVEKAPYSWSKLSFNESPSVRVYHAAGLCSTGPANGMMVVFGGRTLDQSALSDTWGLRRHRDGRWDWVKKLLKLKKKNEFSGRKYLKKINKFIRFKPPTKIINTHHVLGISIRFILLGPYFL